MPVSDKEIRKSLKSLLKAEEHKKCKEFNCRSRNTENPS